MNHGRNDTENLTVRLDELEAEKELTENLLLEDAGDMEFSQEFFDRMHDKIMCEVQNREILPAPKPWQKINWRKIAKQSSTAATLVLSISTVTLIASSLYATATTPKATWSQRLSKSDLLVRESIKSPENFNRLISASLGQSDFFVDLASQNFDHLSTDDLDDIMGSTTED